MFIVLCGGPGTGKTTASNLACSFVKKMNKRLPAGTKSLYFGPDKMTPAALLKRFTYATRTLKAETGEAFEQSALYLHSTEFATMIKDIGGGSLSDDLLKLYDCDDFFDKELSGEGLISVPGPCLNLLADTTPAFLSGFLPREESGTGLTARIIFATEFGKVEMDEEVPNGDKAIRERILNHLARMFRMSGACTVTSSAKVYWAEWFKRYRDELFSLSDGSYMRNFYARKPTHLRKIAMVLSASRSSNRVIEQRDFEEALELVNEAEPFMSRSFGVKDFKKVDDAIKVILEAMPYFPSEISKQKLIALLFENGMSGAGTELDGMIRTLIEGGMVKQRIEGIKYFYSRLTL